MVNELYKCEKCGVIDNSPKMAYRGKPYHIKCLEEELGMTIKYDYSVNGFEVRPMIIDDSEPLTERSESSIR